MKQKYLSLIMILSACHTVFSMEDEKLAQIITKSYKLAERLDREGKLQAALDKYKEVINIKLSDPNPTLYKEERDYQNKATTKITDLEITLMIQLLIYANKYDEAFTQLNTLSAEKQTTNKQIIQKLKKKIIDNKLNWEKNQLKEAEELADAGNYTRAYQTLDTLKTQQISSETNNQAIQLKARIEKIVQLQLIDAQQAAGDGNYAEAYRILDALMNEGYLAANVLKNKIIEQQRQAEETQRTAQPPTSQQIAQEQNLKNALARLTNTLKSITKYLPSITRPRAPTSQLPPETICLEPLAKKPSKPSVRRPRTKPIPGEIFEKPKEPEKPEEPQQKTSEELMKIVREAINAKEVIKDNAAITKYLNEKGLYPGIYAVELDFKAKLSNFLRQKD